MFKIGIIRNGPIIWKPPKLDYFDAHRQATDTQQISNVVLPSDWIQADIGSQTEYNTTNTVDWAVNAGYQSDVIANITFLIKQKIKYIDWSMWRIRTNAVPTYGDYEYAFIELSIRRTVGAGTPLFVINDVMGGGSSYEYAKSGRVWMHDFIVEPNMVLEIKMVAMILVSTTKLRVLVNANSIKFV